MEGQQELKEINEEELQVYDRQRFIGVEVQKRLLSSKVMINNMTAINTELAKNLILCGVNIFIYDSGAITMEDIETNFLLGQADLQKQRGVEIARKLQEMNPMVNISLYENFSITEYFKSYYDSENVDEHNEGINNMLKEFDIIVTNTTNFLEMEQWDKISKLLNVPYYNLVCCGFSGFFYASLGSNFEFIEQKKQPQNQALNPEGPQEFEKVTIKSLELEKTLDPNKKRCKSIYKAIQMMRNAELLKLGLDIYRPENDLNEQENLKKILEIAYTQLNIKKEEEQVYSNFAKFFGVNYCPVYSVISGVASQEFIKVIGRNQQPALYWFCYDSDEGYGKMENVQGARSYPRETINKA